MYLEKDPECFAAKPQVMGRRLDTAPCPLAASYLDLCKLFCMHEGKGFFFSGQASKPGFPVDSR